MKTYILIDDDELIRMTWEYKAQASSVKLKTYSNVDDFLNEEVGVDRWSPIYLDSELGTVLGEDFVVELKKLGFEHVHLATGKEVSKITKNTQLFDSIGGKTPPF